MVESLHKTKDHWPVSERALWSRKGNEVSRDIEINGDFLCVMINGPKEELLIFGDKSYNFQAFFTFTSTQRPSTYVLLCLVCKNHGLSIEFCFSEFLLNFS